MNNNCEFCCLLHVTLLNEAINKCNNKKKVDAERGRRMRNGKITVNLFPHIVYYNGKNLKNI